ncbi:Alpha/beta hydrolase family protein [Pigmentiphaga humi]|uniref:Alpha/beta hydrolase family protein n=1 Tax=Pigmentiphaga humi TaxID=2478468 RepID=A0A3P4B809_9BURK|nr:alpha/beta hydrolase [Pigmentiphaga humi]VCU71828.1 Alpha/beta hydrolase family protein [Pigmentiphaga humi]
MAVSTESLVFEGQAGAVDCAFDIPDGGIDAARGWALMLHPHPLFGGTRDNKVVTTVARACAQQGLAVLRPNFRGVGKSAGEFDNGSGEAADMLAVASQFRARFPALAQGVFVLGGFSFGSAVASQVHAGCTRQDGGWPVAGLMLLGTAASRFSVAIVPEDTLVVHGEQDDTVPLASVMDWARPQSLPVTVIPGSGHFFHGSLVVVKRLVLDYLGRVLPRAGAR